MAESKYEVEIDLQERNSTYWHIADMVGSGKRILDIGCDTGYFGKALMDKGNEVQGVEYVGETAEKARERLPNVLVADLESTDLVAEFGESVFDAVIFADVLEHLRDPAPVLRNATRLLAPGGSVLISVPNVAHGDVRLALLDGRWEYTTTGLLDKTHTRFFTRASLEPFLADAGLVLADLRRTRVPMFHSEQNVRREDYAAEIVDRIEADPESGTYQFVLNAVPTTAGAATAALANRGYDLQLQVDQLDEQLQRRDAALAAAQAELAEAADRRATSPIETVSLRAAMSARFPAPHASIGESADRVVEIRLIGGL